jgi:2-haloacid dehalogenase
MSVEHPPRFKGVEVVFFDLYGTLVDWRYAIGSFIAHYAGREFVEDFFECDIREVAEYRPYSLILEKCLVEVLGKAGVKASRELVESFILTFARSPPFPDTIYGLTLLKRRGLKAAILSNTERRLIDITLYGFKHLLDYVITAEDVKAYKPSLEAFVRAYEAAGVQLERVLHVSAYPQYDLVPASKLGVKTVLVDRGLGYRWEPAVKSLVELVEIID